MKQGNKFDINDLKQFDIKEYLIKVISHWKLFLAMLFLGLFIASFVNRYKEKKYSLNSLITVKEEQNPLFTSNTNIAFNWGGPSDKVETVITILKSRTHNEMVVDSLKYYIEYLQEGSYRMVDVYGKVPFKIELDSLSHQLLNTPIKLEFLENGKVSLSVDFEEEEMSMMNYKTRSMTSYVAEENSFSNKYKINDTIETPFCKFDLQIIKPTEKLSGKTYYVKFKNYNGIVSSYQNINANSYTKGTSIIELELLGPNKKKLEDYINTTVYILDSVQSYQKIEYAKKTKDYIDKVFQLASDTLELIEKDLGDYKLKNKVYDLSIEGQSLFNEVNILDKQQQQVTDRLQYYNNLENYIMSNNEISDDIPAPVNVSIEDPNITKYIVELVDLSKQKKYLKQTVTPDYPPLKNLNDEINITRSVILENISNLKNETRIGLSNINKRLETYNTRLNTLPKKEQGLLKFEREFSLTESNYAFLKQKQYEAGAAIAANVSDIKTLDEAKDVGQRYISPQPLFNYLVAVMLSLGLPFLFIIIKEAFSNKILTVEELEKTYKIPVLGVIGQSKDRFLFSGIRKAKIYLGRILQGITF